MQIVTFINGIVECLMTFSEHAKPYVSGSGTYLVPSIIYLQIVASDIAYAYHCGPLSPLNDSKMIYTLLQTKPINLLDI
jgi:hypothetical protein